MRLIFLLLAAGCASPVPKLEPPTGEHGMTRFRHPLDGLYNPALADCTVTFADGPTWSHDALGRRTSEVLVSDERLVETQVSLLWILPKEVKERAAKGKFSRPGKRTGVAPSVWQNPMKK